MFIYEDVFLNDELAGFPSSLVVGGEPVVVSKTDDFTLVFDFAAPNLLFPMHMAGIDGDRWARYPKHCLTQFHVKYADPAVLSALVKEAGVEQWYQLFGGKGHIRSNVEFPVIFPWKLTVAAPKQPIVAERNPHYWKADTQGSQLPYVDCIEWMLAQSSDQVSLRALVGEVDLQGRHQSFGTYPLMSESEAKGGYWVLLWDRVGAPVALYNPRCEWLRSLRCSVPSNTGASWHPQGPSRW